MITIKEVLDIIERNMIKHRTFMIAAANNGKADDTLGHSCSMMALLMVKTEIEEKITSKLPEILMKRLENFENDIKKYPSEKVTAEMVAEAVLDKPIYG